MGDPIGITQPSQTLNLRELCDASRRGEPRRIENPRRGDRLLPRLEAMFGTEGVFCAFDAAGLVIEEA
jgi:hypothetical protein